MEENKELIIKWFESIRDNLNEHFPTRLSEHLKCQKGSDLQRSSELSSVNNSIAFCNSCIDYIKKFM